MLPDKLQIGMRHGGWCIGCCSALMASLFALGVMSIVWMAFVAGLIVTTVSLAYLTREETRTQARIDRRLTELQQASRRNGHSPYSRAWPATRRGR